MKPRSKSVFYIDLERKEAEKKVHEDLFPLLGGWGVAQKIFKDNSERDPLIFSIGPLTGAFPFCSPTGVFHPAESGQLQEDYVGGRLGLVLRLAGVDAVVFLGSSETPLIVEVSDRVVLADYLAGSEGPLGAFGLSGRRSRVRFAEREMVVDDFFRVKDASLAKKARGKNLFGVVASGLGELGLGDSKLYEETYQGVLKEINKVSAVAGSGPSGSGCPLGCAGAEVLSPYPPRPPSDSEGEAGPPAARLSKYLIACPAASKVFEDIPTVFSCLSSLGYPYTHEDLENLSRLVDQL